MRASTYWNAYKKTLTLYLIAGLKNNCDDMAHYIKTLELIGKVNEYYPGRAEEQEL